MNSGSLPMICRAFSLRDRPSNALQASALIESASVMGALTDKRSIRTIMPLCERTHSHTWLRTSSLVRLTTLRFRAAVLKRATDPPIRWAGAHTQ